MGDWFRVGVDAAAAAAERQLEGQLIHRVKTGDEQAVRTLIAKHRARIVRTAANLLRDQCEAEDVSQEAFLKAFRTIGKLRDDRAFPGFLYRICVRLCMDRLRTRRISVTELEPSVPTQSPSVETRLVVDRLLVKLPYDLRTTLILRELDQLSYEEIAETMSVPVGTVRSRLHSARIRFRQLYLEEMGRQ